MSVVDLTLKDKEFVPFWNELSVAKSSELWLPIETAYAALGVTLSNNYLRLPEVNSWFSITQALPQKKNLLTTCLPLSQYLQQEVTALESTKPKLNPKEKILTRKIEIKPTREQKNKLAEIFGICRYFYNWAVEILNRPGQLASLKGVWAIIKSEGIPTWASNCPYDAYYQAVKDAVIAMQTLKKLSKKDKKPRKLKFRSRKGNQNTYINRLGKTGIYKSFLGHIKLTESIKESSIGKSGRICLQNNRYFLSTVFTQEQYSTENQSRIIALDPGIRNFVTFYDHEGNNGFIGKHAVNRIQRLCSFLDRLISKRDKATNKKKKSGYQIAEKRIRHRISNLISDLHWKTANWLVRNYDYILLPKFETQQMSKRSTRKLNSKTTRAMLTLSHYSFRCILEHLCWKHNKTLALANESFTSKTNPVTGLIIGNLGGKKKINISSGFVDRDINGARNILLRALVNLPFTSSK